MEERKGCSSFIPSSLLLFECKNCTWFNLNSEINLAVENMLFAVVLVYLTVKTLKTINEVRIKQTKETKKKKLSRITKLKT